MTVERRTLWLGATLVVAILAVIVVRSTDETSSNAGTPAPAVVAGGDAGRTGSGAVAQTALELRLDRLKRTRGEPVDQGRNPFEFRAKPAPPPPAPRPTNQAAVSPVTPMLPVGPPPPPPIALKFIGIVEKADGTRIAVLSDGKRPISGKEGEEIEGRYKIWKIGLESIELSYLDGRGRQTIRLTGQ